MALILNFYLIKKKMNPRLTLNDLYHSVLKDCLKISYDKGSEEIKEELKKIENDYLELVKTFRSIFTNGFKNYKGKFIKDYAIEFLNKTENSLILSETLPDITQEITKDDVYASFGFLWCFLFLNNSAKFEDISLFKYELLNNFANFLNEYGHIPEMKKNYEYFWKKKDINVKNVSSFLKKLEMKKLNSVKTPNNIFNQSGKNMKNLEKENKKEKILEDKKEEENKTILEENIKEEEKKEEVIKEDEKKDEERGKEEEKINEITSSNLMNLKKDEYQKEEEIIEKEAQNQIITSEIENSHIEKEKEDSNTIYEEAKDTAKTSNISHDELVNIVITLQKETKEFSEKIPKLEERVEKLEKNQKLLFYQLSMYQFRDMAKNIYYYFAQHLKLKNEEKPFYDLKNIMKYLKGNKSEIYSEDEMTKLRKFFKTIFFIMLVSNKILHNQLSSTIKNAINQTKDNDLLSLLPPNNYSQLFESLKNYLKFNTKDVKLQLAMNFIYESYERDNELGDIKDVEKEAISKNGESITMLIEEKDINDVKEMLDKIVIGQLNFSKLCDTKTYDTTV